MRVLVACEFSQRVCIAFRERGHEAFSCDLLPAEGGHPEWHICDDVLDYLSDGWDMMIAHPPRTYLANSGIRWFDEKQYGDKARERKRLREEAFLFILKLATAPIEKIAIENPVGWLNTHWRKPDQIIQPWMFGEPESKRTCLWLKNLPLLHSTQIVKPKTYSYFKKGKHSGEPIYWSNYLSNSDDRWKKRSETFLGIAKAMAEQRGDWSENEHKKS